jgi:hypothetical protein
MRILFWARVATGAFGSFRPVSGVSCWLVLCVREASPRVCCGTRPLLVSLDVAVAAGRARRRSLLSYWMTSVTTPEPTVRPPSRIAKRRPWSMAIGWISSISIWTLSPGMTISVPSGRFATPVTSVVRK